MAEQYSLNWNNYKLSMTDSLKTIMTDEDFVDVTLHTEGRTVKAHKVYLGACSRYFKHVLKGTNIWQHPVLFLANVPFKDLQKILEFIYCGEVTVPQQELQSFLRSAETLQISGLVDAAQGAAVPEGEQQQQDSVLFSSKQPKKKKKRKATEEFERNERSLSIREESLAAAASAAEAPAGLSIREESIAAAEAGIGDARPGLITENANGGSIVKLETRDWLAEGGSEEVAVKMDPEDFRGSEEGEDEEEGGNRGINIRSDLLGPPTLPPALYGERGRCHFCSLLCPDRGTLTEHLKLAHQPAKHALCDNCENFFHICAIQRHKLKCKARYQTDK